MGMSKFVTVSCEPYNCEHHPACSLREWLCIEAKAGGRGGGRWGAGSGTITLVLPEFKSLTLHDVTTGKLTGSFKSAIGI